MQLEGGKRNQKAEGRNTARARRHSDGRPLWQRTHKGTDAAVVPARARVYESEREASREKEKAGKGKRQRDRPVLLTG